MTEVVGSQQSLSVAERTGVRLFLAAAGKIDADRPVIVARRVKGAAAEPVAMARAH